MFFRGWRRSPAMSARVCPVNECHWQKETRSWAGFSQDLKQNRTQITVQIDWLEKCKQKIRVNINLFKGNKEYGIWKLNKSLTIRKTLLGINLKLWDFNKHKSLKFNVFLFSDHYIWIWEKRPTKIPRHTNKAEFNLL